MYPVTLFPMWAQVLAFLNPLVQVMQDIRYIILGAGAPHRIAADVLGGPAGHLLPIMIAILTFVVGLLVFRRDAPKFAERV
jgi:ABC-type polysaccharide/polyol phosphate export permease